MVPTSSLTSHCLWDGSWGATLPTMPGMCHACHPITNDAPVIQHSHPAYEPLLIGWIGLWVLTAQQQMKGDDNGGMTSQWQTMDHKQATNSKQTRDNERGTVNKWGTWVMNKWWMNRGWWRQMVAGMDNNGSNGDNNDGSSSRPPPSLEAWDGGGHYLSFI